MIEHGRAGDVKNCRSKLCVLFYCRHLAEIVLNTKCISPYATVCDFQHSNRFNMELHITHASVVCHQPIASEFSTHSFTLYSDMCVSKLLTQSVLTCTIKHHQSPLTTFSQTLKTGGHIQHRDREGELELLKYNQRFYLDEPIMN